MSIGHAVVVLFNVFRGPTPRGKIRLSHDSAGRPRRQFVRRRWPLFRDFTLPSLVGQSTESFHVLFLHDERTKLGRTWSAIRDAQPTSFQKRFHLVGIPPMDFRLRVHNAFWRARPREDAVLSELFQHTDYLYITYLDSDDLLRKDAVELIQSQQLSRRCQAIMPQNGYIFDSTHDRLRTYNALSPPFFTLRYPTERYFGGLRYDGGAGHHYRVFRRLRCATLDERIFMVHVHGSNDTTRYERRRIAPDFDPAERDAILEGFSIGPSYECPPSDGVAPAVASNPPIVLSTA